MGLSLFLIAATLYGLSVIGYVSWAVLGKGCDVDTGCQSMLFITTTFLSARRIETSLGFPVGNDRDLMGATPPQSPFNDPASTLRDRTYQFGHFIECMYTARMADRTCPPTLSLSSYANCVQNTTLIAGGLSTCATFPTVGGYSHWPTSEEYIACLWNNPLLQNSESRRASQNVFRTCVEQTLWPFFEIPQTLDSPIIFGSYNWGLLLLAGLVVFTSFAVYTTSPTETGHVKRGEGQMFMRLGLAWSTAALVVNLIFFIIMIIVAFRESGNFQSNGGVPTTFSTSMVTLLATGAAVLYFLNIVLLPTGRKFVAVVRRSTGGSVAVIESVPVRTETTDFERQNLMGSTFPMVGPGVQPQAGVVKYELTADQVTRMYTPPLLAIWSDSYLADFCIVLGVAGATGQLTTDSTWLLFTLTLVYRLLNMIISRCMSDSFTNNVRLDDAVNQAKNGIITRPELTYWRKVHDVTFSKDPSSVHLNTNVIGLSTQLSALFIFIAIFGLVFNDNAISGDFQVFRIFMIVCFIVPELLRLLVHVYFQVAYNPESMGEVPWFLYNSFFVIWLTDLVTRISFVLFIFTDTRENPGTFDYLKSQTGLVMRDYVAAMAI